MQRTNVAGRAGRWSSQHRRAAILGWLAFVVVAVFVGGAVGTKHIPQDNNGVGESGRAQQVLHDEFPQPANEQVLIQSAALTVRRSGLPSDDSGRDRAACLRLGTVQNVRSPLLAANHGEVSRDGHSVLVAFQITGKATRRGQARCSVARGDRRRAARASQYANRTSWRRQFHQGVEQELQRRFRQSADAFVADHAADPRGRIRSALLAAGIPVLLAGTGVAATLGLIALVSQIAAVDQVVSETVLLIGMAVGVDYSLFYMRREREERAAGRDEQAALEAAASTSGRSVLVSGLTVMAAMAGMYLAGNKTFASMATGTIMVVAVAVRGLADGVARVAVKARRPSDERAACRSSLAAGRAAVSHECGARSSIESCAARGPRCLSLAALSWRSRSPRSAFTPRCPGSKACPPGFRSSRRSTGSRPRFRAVRYRPTWSSKATT